MARSDCDSAQKLGSAYSAIYTNRGLVHLRLGEIEKSIKDLCKALKLQPKDARSLYGLAMAEHRKRLISDSERDSKLAVAIDPGKGKWFDSIGMTQ